MARSHRSHKRSSNNGGGNKGWKSNSKDGKLLKKLLMKGKITPSMPPGAIKEQYKVFCKYKNGAFASAVRRLKMSLGVLARKPPGDNTGELAQSIHFVAFALFTAVTSNFNVLLSHLSSTDDDVSLGTKDSNDDDDDDDDDELVYDDDDEAEELPAVSRQVLETQDQAFGGPPAAISVARPPAFGGSLSGPSVARMPGGNGGGYEMIGARPSISYNWTPPHIKATYIDANQISHVLVAFLLPSGIGVKDAHDFRLGIKIFGIDYYVSLEIEWPDTFDLDNGEIFLGHLQRRQLKQLKKKWMDLKTIEETKKAKREFDRSHVMRCMAVQQEMIRYRNSKGTTQLRSETAVKLDFPTERLTDKNWWLLGDDETGDGGVRMVVVDLEQATADEHQGQVIDREVEMIGAHDTEEE